MQAISSLVRRSLGRSSPTSSEGGHSERSAPREPSLSVDYLLAQMNLQPAGPKIRAEFTKILADLARTVAEESKEGYLGTFVDALLEEVLGDDHGDVTGFTDTKALMHIGAAAYAKYRPVSGRPALMQAAHNTTTAIGASEAVVRESLSPQRPQRQAAQVAQQLFRDVAAGEAEGAEVIIASRPPPPQVSQGPRPLTQTIPQPQPAQTITQTQPAQRATQRIPDQPPIDWAGRAPPSSTVSVGSMNSSDESSSTSNSRGSASSSGRSSRSSKGSRRHKKKKHRSKIPPVDEDPWPEKVLWKAQHWQERVAEGALVDDLKSTLRAKIGLDRDIPENDSFPTRVARERLAAIIRWINNGFFRAMLVDVKIDLRELFLQHIFATQGTEAAKAARESFNRDNLPKEERRAAEKAAKAKLEGAKPAKRNATSTKSTSEKAEQFNGRVVLPSVWRKLSEDDKSVILKIVKK